MMTEKQLNDFLMKQNQELIKERSEPVTAVWQPIEQAPKDWSSILLYVPDFIPDEDSDSEPEDEYMCVGYFSCEDGGINMWLDASTDMPICPTHFMPLPEPPK